MESILPIPPSALLSLRESSQDILGGKKKLQPPCCGPPRSGPGKTAKAQEQVTITGDWEAAEGGRVPQSPWEGRTRSSLPVHGELGVHVGPCSSDSGVLKMQMLSGRPRVEERKSKETACFLSRSGCSGFAKGQKGWEGGEEGGREEGTHLKPIARNLCSLLIATCNPTCSDPITQTPHTQGHNPGLLPPT